MLRITKESRYHPGDGSPRVKYSITWFKGSLVRSVCTRVLMDPIVIFRDTVFGNSRGMFPKKPLEMERTGGVSSRLL